MTLDLDADRKIALAYVPAARRAAVEALWRLDVTFASALATGREPMVSRIRLAWWRESLEKLDCEPPPPEPVLEALATCVLAAGINGGELAAMEPGWAVLASSERLGEDDLTSHAKERGARLFRLTARLLGDVDFPVELAGETWALVDLARHSADAQDAWAALAAAREREVPSPWPAALRPLGMLALLALRDSRRDLGRHGSPARLWRMMRHWLTGR